LANDAEELWKLISDPNYTKVNALPHDAYVKIWQLSKPTNLQDTERVDCIMIDEAQDMNGAMLDVFLHQTGCPRIIVGDPYQQIYQWRKSQLFFYAGHSQYLFSFDPSHTQDLLSMRLMTEFRPLMFTTLLT